MVRVRVRMMGVLRDASGRSEEELRLSDGVNVSSAIGRLIEMYGEAFERALIDPVVMSPVPSALILLNGVEIGNIGGLETPVGDGDTIVLLPVTHGG
ncbi:MAG: MoaD/ThiS family protein [Candidatus Bathyarchaeota archaeon]|nr:MoaD/ThiS family protein [Candidatus Bathyarchaeota archaeon]